MDLVQKYKLHLPENLKITDKILIIDHQQDMRLILVHHLNKLSYSNIIQAKDGMQAMEILKNQGDIAIIICTMNLPQMNALELLTEIREDITIHRPPFCLTMENVSKDKLMLAVETGVDEIIVKPFTLADVVPKIRKGFQIFYNPKNPENIYELAKAKIREKNLAAAKEIYQSLHESSPKSARPLVGLAKVSIAEGDHAKAFSYLEQAEKNNPQYVHIYSLRGDIYSKDKKFDDAIKSYKDAINLSPLNPYRYKASAEILLSCEKYQEIADILNIAVEKGVEFNEILHYLSQAYYHLKDYKKAVKYIRKAVDHEPENVVYINQLALSFKESGELEEAKKLYNRVIKLDPDNLQALFNKAIMLSQHEKSEEAIKILQRVVEKYPDFEKAREKLKSLTS